MQESLPEAKLKSDNCFFWLTAGPSGGLVQQGHASVVKISSKPFLLYFKKV